MPLAVANAWAFSKLLLATALHVALAASAIETTFFLAIEPGPKIPHLTVVASGDAADAMLLEEDLAGLPSRACYKIGEERARAQSTQVISPFSVSTLQVLSRVPGVLEVTQRD